MKKYLVFPIVLTVLLSGVASAEVSSSGPSRINDVKQKITDIKQQANQEKENIKARVASTTANIMQEFKSAAEIRIGKKLDQQKTKVSDTFEKAIQNLKDLVSRAESRMAKMEASNINTSAQKILLQTANTKISLAETELANLENLLAQNIPTATSTKISERKILLQSIKAQSDKTKNTIKVAHQSIVDVINSLKPGQSKEKNSTSTQNEVSTSTGSTTNN